MVNLLGWIGGDGRGSVGFGSPMAMSYWRVMLRRRVRPKIRNFIIKIKRIF